MSIWEHIWATDKFYMDLYGGPCFTMVGKVNDTIAYAPRTATLWMNDNRGWSDDGRYVADNTSCWKKELIL